MQDWSVLLPVCSHGVSQLSFSTDICVFVLKPFYAGASPMATPCVRVTEFKLCMALLAWESVPFLPRCVVNVALPAGLSNPESQLQPLEYPQHEPYVPTRWEIVEETCSGKK